MVYLSELKSGLTCCFQLKADSGIMSGNLDLVCEESKLKFIPLQHTSPGLCSNFQIRVLCCIRYRVLSEFVIMGSTVSPNCV